MIFLLQNLIDWSSPLLYVGEIWAYMYEYFCYKTGIFYFLTFCHCNSHRIYWCSRGLVGVDFFFLHYPYKCTKQQLLADFCLIGAKVNFLLLSLAWSTPPVYHPLMPSSLGSPQGDLSRLICIHERSTRCTFSIEPLSEQWILADAKIHSCFI